MGHMMYQEPFSDVDGHSNAGRFTDRFALDVICYIAIQVGFVAFITSLIVDGLRKGAQIRDRLGKSSLNLALYSLTSWNKHKHKHKNIPLNKLNNQNKEEC